MSDIGVNFFEEFRKMMEHLAAQIEANTANIIQVSHQTNAAKIDIGTLDTRLVNVEEDVKTIKDNEKVSRSQRRKIKQTLLSRVGEILKLKYEGGVLADESIPTAKKYRQGFIMRAYTDAKRKGVMEDPVEETPKRNFQTCIEYLEAWTPEVRGGIAGYMRYLDKLRKDRLSAGPRKKTNKSR